MKFLVWFCFAVLDCILLFNLPFFENGIFPGGIRALILIACSFALASLLCKKLGEDESTPSVLTTEHKTQNPDTAKTEPAIKIARGSGRFDSSGYLKTVRFLHIRNSELSRNRIILKQVAFIMWGFILLAFGGYMSFGSISFLLSESLTGKFLSMKEWFVLIYGGLIAVFFLQALPGTAIGEPLTLKKYFRNEFILVKAKITHIYEDMRKADPETRPDCYCTCEYSMANTQKTIHIRGSSIEAETLAKNPTVYLLFLTNDGSMEDSPKKLIYGDNYQIEDTIAVYDDTHTPSF